MVACTMTGESGDATRGPIAYALATLVVGACTGLDWLLRDAVSESDLVMVYLLGVLVVARVFALGPALWAAAASVAAFDVLFVDPRFTFAVADTRYLISFAVMGVTGLVLASTTARTRMEASRARDRAHRLEVLGLERARLAEAQQRAEMDAEQERLRSSLLSSVSHDLRTPLGSIMGAASTLLDRSHLDEEDRTALLQSIHEEASRLSRLLDNLLQMTRIEGGALRVEKDFEVPEELVGAVLARFGDRMRAREVVVEIDEDPALVPFDALSMDLVLTNVLDNACTHAPAGTRMWIRGHRAGDRYRFVVEDEGPGVPAAEREAIFEKFRRGGTGSGKGAGLGLAICRAVVRAHGGEITAEGRGDAPGLRVVIDLPFDPTASAAEEPW
jgi:K+-sensing histidine kinase KdpD